MKEPDWISTIKELDQTTFGLVRLIIDGYNVCFKNEICGKKIVICYYVDNVWKGEYFGVDNPVGQKFGRPIIRKIPVKTCNLIKMLNGKAAYKEALKKRIICGHSNHWYNSKSLIAHLKRTCHYFNTYNLK